MQGKTVFLILRKRRYVCSCGKRFYEKYSFLTKYHRRTQRMSFLIIHLLRQTFSLKQVSALTGISVSVISKLLDPLNYEAVSTLPEMLSIDEFKGNASTGKFQCILVDAKKHKILDILPDRTQHHLIDY